MPKETMTAENFQKLDELIVQEKETKGALIQVLQKAQGIFGYLPLEVQQKISKGLRIPMSEIYGVVTFYSQFNLEPKGDYMISVCMGTACYVRNAQPILDEISKFTGIKSGETTEDKKFSLIACRCIGACGLAPIITINEDVYGRLEVEDVKGIMEKY